MKLTTFFRSAASYQVRITLNLKGLPFEALPIHLSKYGVQNQPGFKAINSQGLVPQIFSARRFEGDSWQAQTLVRIDDACLQMEALAAALPSRQPDAASSQACSKNEKQR